MYQVSIFNNEVETIIHTPIPDKSLPHLLSIPLKESLSMPEQLSFLIPINNPGYNLIQGLNTKVKVFDTRDNKVVFSGRVIPIKDGMTTDGKFHKTVTCEGALAFLNDSHTRMWNFTNQTPQQILQFLLDKHNEKMDNSRKINLGIIEVEQPITIDANYETTLNAIVTKIKNVLGGDIRVRETSGQLYLDYLIAQGVNNGVEVRLSKNLKEIIREYNPTDIVTRVIPLGYGEGINQLDITKVNNGVEYIEDAAAIMLYGVIEDTAVKKDIQNADTLKVYGQTVLNEKKQPRFTYQQTALDLSVLPGHENEKYELGDTLHTIAEVINIDVYSRVIERERDLLLSPWNPKLTISTRPIRLTDQIVDLKQRNLTLENAPQGSTCIFALSKAENADLNHPVEFDLDIPNEAININKVYINLHGRKYRAYEKSVTGGASSKNSSGRVNSYVDARIYVQEESGDPPPLFVEITHDVLDHEHDISHTHNNTLEYGIYENSFPKNVKISINDEDIGVNYGEGSASFDEYNINITSFIKKGNNKIKITTEQIGRIDAIIYTQIFIQSK